MNEFHWRERASRRKEEKARTESGAGRERDGDRERGKALYAGQLIDARAQRRVRVRSRVARTCAWLPSAFR